MGVSLGGEKVGAVKFQDLRFGHKFLGIAVLLKNFSFGKSLRRMAFWTSRVRSEIQWVRVEQVG